MSSASDIHSMKMASLQEAAYVSSIAAAQAPPWVVNPQPANIVHGPTIGKSGATVDTVFQAGINVRKVANGYILEIAPNHWTPASIFIASTISEVRDLLMAQMALAKLEDI